MISEKLKKRLSGAALFVMGAVSAALILFISNNEKTVSFFLGALFGIGLLIAANYLMRHWLTYQGFKTCLLYTSPSPRDLSTSRMPSSA